MVNRFTFERYLLAICLWLSLPAASVGSEFSSVGKLIESDSRRLESLSLPDEQGRQVTTVFMNQVTLLHFWATWCVPCQKELPDLERLQDKFGNQTDFRIVTVAMDNPELVKKYIVKHKLALEVLIDQFGKGLHQYKVDAIPKTYLIDRNARLRYTVRGYLNWNEQGAHTVITKLLQE